MSTIIMNRTDSTSAAYVASLKPSLSKTPALIAVIALMLALVYASLAMAQPALTIFAGLCTVIVAFYAATTFIYERA